MAVVTPAAAALRGGVPSANLSLRLKLRPDLVQDFPAYAQARGMGTSTLLGLLVWNDSVRPNPGLTQIAGLARFARAPLSCSMRGHQRVLAARRARELSLSLNAYLESLIAAQLAQPRGPLLILPADRK